MKNIAFKEDDALEKKKLLNAYKNLLRSCKPHITQEDRKEIRKAFKLAGECHKGMRRKSGELYIFHPVAVATICAREIGLGATSIICALLHDAVEDTDLKLEDIEAEFGKKVAEIIDGLTKIKGIVGKTNSAQAENFRKILLTLADDVRVILIKLADRLHNMRTLESVHRTNQLKIASETLVLFAPLAHRLGLNAIKNELEDLALKYTEPAVYKEISRKLKSSKDQRNRFIRKFIAPLQKSLDQHGLKFEIKGRPKSIYSIYQKMKKQDIPFEKVYDLFAVRVVVDSPPELEKADCWRIYSIVTDHYRPNPDRLRDWISTPKANGYESLHTTVMGPGGKWVEVQVRSTRMDEVAEKGYAAHWKYKENAPTDTGLEEWLKRIRDLLDNPEPNALEFINVFKMNLFSDEVFVFTPRGELTTLPSKATALDFAFAIHTDIGLRCLGAKVNHKLVPLSYQLKNGDQAEILTSKKQKPNEDWLNFVVTAKARSKIKQAMKEEKRYVAQIGEEKVAAGFKSAKIPFSRKHAQMLVEYFNTESPLDLYYKIGSEKISGNALEKAYTIFDPGKATPGKGYPRGRQDKNAHPSNFKREVEIMGENAKDLAYKFAKCCNPIPGDDIFGFLTINDGIKIHRTNCPNGIRLMSNYGYRIVKAQWAIPKIEGNKTFVVGIKITGIDSLGIVSKITDQISGQLKVNMEEITISARDGAFEGSIILNIFDTSHLEELMGKIRSLQGIEAVTRYNVEDSLLKPE